MKNIITLVVLLLIVGVTNSQQIKEKRIKFNQGTLKICSSSHMTIKGYDGNEVVIKSLNGELPFSHFYNFKDNKKFKIKSKDTLLIRNYGFILDQNNEKELEKGLKPLGNKSTNPEDNLYLDITEKPGELIIKDYNYNKSNNKKLVGYALQATDKKGKAKKSETSRAAALSNVLYTNNKYLILIPNTIKLSWNAENCTKKNSNTFFLRTTSQPWELHDFKGEVEISTSYNSINLTNVDGPVVANTIGGNITVIFNDDAPKKLYSLVSNDGYIDVTLPDNSDISVDATGDRILSNIDFTILDETITEGTKGMELQLKSGKTKMKLDAGSGSVYLRKQE
ncbi:hypothetical protein [Winogradskyella sp.]|uniref:hypothetical protein n=1 Tax=Winogradskyella sp. TaxID=1883156 RepID=UPI00261E788D|nr:hypothetical protein [Winogradskyella sp.]